MKITSILDSIYEILKKKYKSNQFTFDDSEQGVKTPAFFMQILPINESPISKYHYEQKLLVAITYLQDKQSKYELAKKIDELRKIFSMILEVEDRKLLIKNKEWNILSNDRLNFTFVLDFVDGLEIDNIYDYYPAEMMKELYLKGVDE